MTEKLNKINFLLVNVCGTRFVFLSDLTFRGDVHCKSPLNFARLLEEREGKASNISINTV